MYLYPDLDTFVIFPWRPQQGKVARIICDVYTSDRKPFEGDPRYILKKAVEDATQMGYRFDVGPECEFFLFNQDEDGQPTTISTERAGYFDLGPIDLGENARRDMVLTLEDMGYEIEASHHEVAPAQILNLIRELQNELGLTSLFVGHGLGAVRYVSDRIAVMYLGKIVEIADAGEVFMHPVHPYTKALTQAAPVADPGRREEKSAVLTGEVASAVHPPKGCRFHPRCPYAREDCSVSEPMLLPMAEKPDHLVACPYYEGTETA